MKNNIISNLDEIIETIEHISGVEISKKCRETKYVILRNIYYKIARDYTSFSLVEIARKLNRTHATVLNGLKTVDQDLKREGFNKIYELSLEMLNIIQVEDEETKTKNQITIEELRTQLEKFNAIDTEILKIISTFDENQQQEFKVNKLIPHKKLIESRVEPVKFVKVAGAKILR